MRFVVSVASRSRLTQLRRALAYYVYEIPRDTSAILEPLVVQVVENESNDATKKHDPNCQQSPTHFMDRVRSVFRLR
jgi:hypothetical protein